MYSNRCWFIRCDVAGFTATFTSVQEAPSYLKDEKKRRANTYNQRSVLAPARQRKPQVIGYFTTQLPYNHIMKSYPKDYTLEQLLLTSLPSFFVVLSCLELL